MSVNRVVLVKVIKLHLNHHKKSPVPSCCCFTVQRSFTQYIQSTYSLIHLAKKSYLLGFHPLHWSRHDSVDIVCLHSIEKNADSLNTCAMYSPKSIILDTLSLTSKQQTNEPFQNKIHYIQALLSACVVLELVLKGTDSLQSRHLALCLLLLDL